jgi:RNA polymerase sigma factor (sigma-70 family)
MTLSGGDADRREAAVRLISAHEPVLRRTARRWSICADDADDAYQRALEILLTKAPTDSPDDLLRWMQTVTKHEALAVRRQRERLLGLPVAAEASAGDPLDSLPSQLAGPGDRIERSERIARSSEALSALKPQEARALALGAGGYSYREIGRLTGWTYTKVNRCMAEGRKRFLELYASLEDGSRCEELADELAGLARGENGGPSPPLRRHLRGCGRCRAVLRRERETRSGLLGALTPLLLLPRSLWDRVGEAVSGSGGGRIQAGSDAAGRFIEAVGAGKATAAVALTVAAVGGGAATVHKAVEDEAAKARQGAATAAGAVQGPAAMADSATEADRRDEPDHATTPGVDTQKPQVKATLDRAIGTPDSAGTPIAAPSRRRPIAPGPSTDGGSEFGP